MDTRTLRIARGTPAIEEISSFTPASAELISMMAF
jgi:hypothetical protein